MLGRVEGWAGSVRTCSRLAMSAGNANASFFPANSGALAGDASAAAGVAMAAHQDASFARYAIPAPTAATSTTIGTVAFNPRDTDVIDNPLRFLDDLVGWVERSEPHQNPRRTAGGARCAQPTLPRA
jgi:hypothetical protein